MALTAAAPMKRVFTAKIKGKSVDLPDPNPAWSANAVLNHYCGIYAELTTAKAGDPVVKNDAYHYEFSSVMGNKG